MQDESILNKNPQAVQDYLNELAIALCIKGERLEKYEKIAIKRCGSEAYANMMLFVEEVQRSVERGKFTNTSKVNLSYLGKNAGLSENIVNKIIQHFEVEFGEEAFWNQCRPNKKTGYKNYLDKYPNGKYASKARAILAEIEMKEAIERSELEEKNYWNKCQTSDKSGFLKYLAKYPNGKYASTARSIIANLEKKGRESEEQECWNRCHDRESYLKYLGQYPDGKYAADARERKKELEKKAKLEREAYVEEQQMWDQCRTKDDYQRYVDRYPRGVYASKAYQKIQQAEKEEKRKKEEAAKAKFAEEQKKKEKERQRSEEQRKRKEEEMLRQQEERQKETIKQVIKWISIIAAIIVWFSIEETGWIYAAAILGVMYFLVRDKH